MLRLEFTYSVETLEGVHHSPEIRCQQHFGQKNSQENYSKIAHSATEWRYSCVTICQGFE
jgi:hypothetical protein